MIFEFEIEKKPKFVIQTITYPIQFIEAVFIAIVVVVWNRPGMASL